ncbi:MAG: C10 family peptidase [Bacteroidota bacterium]
MKNLKIILCLCISFIFQSSFAQTVNKDYAMVIANSQLILSEKQNSFSVKSCEEIVQGNIPFCYVVLIEPTGFLVVSADKNLPPVLAYSFENDFGNISNDNPLLTLLKADISSRIKYSSENNITEKYEQVWNKLLNGDYNKSSDSTFQQWPDVGDGWLKTNWTQDAPYKNFCPIDPVTSQRSIAGCPAVAMAQILNFHETTNNMHFDDNDDYYHNYAGRQYMIDDDYSLHGFPSFPELNEYLDTLNAHYTNNIIPTDTDKATLTFACGVAATQVYTSSGSGTFSVSQALAAYLRFGFSTVELLDSNDTDLYDRLKQNIKDTLPAHLAVVDSAWSMGHNVVVDGYNTDEYYHLNFGWGGSYNGWYLLPQEIPYNLTVIEGVVVDIIKPNIASINNETAGTSVITVYPNPFVESATISGYLNTPGEIQLKIYDTTGKMIKEIPLEQKSSGNFKIPVSMLRQALGVYYYQITLDGGIQTGKIIKQ